MRKCYINILAACAALIFISSCVKDQPQPSGPASEDLEEMTVEAEVATKTVMNTDNTVDWSVGDAISVFSTSHRVNHSFGSSHSAVSHLTTFSGKIEKGTTGVLALYPYTASAAYSGDTVTGMSIPTTQTATETSFANGASVTIAKGTKTADAKTVVLLFDNLCSVLRFTVPEGIKQSSSIRIESINSNVKMSGAVSINSTTEDIISATTEYVDLSGSFTAGRTYCVTVAPGNYDQGFRFTISGTGGNTLVREAPAVNAEKGKVYNIGALNPVISGDPVTCSISHTYENNTLTGTNATVTLSAPQNEFASNIKGWRLDNVTIKSQDGTVLYRTLANTSSTNGQTITLSQASGKPYIPHGSYTFSADIYYTVYKADGTPAEKLYQANFTKTVTSPSPDASRFTLTATPTGYTSYSVYKGTDGQTASAANANNVKNDVIKGIGAQYTGGLSSQVYAQCSNLLSFTATYKNGDSYYSPDANGNSAEWLSWGEHKVKCTSITFDGVTQSCSSEKTVYISGLPYELTHKADDNSKTHGHPWKLFDNGYIKFHSDNIEIWTAAGQPIAQSYKGFYVKSGSISTKVSWRIQRTDGNKPRDVGIRQSGTDELSYNLAVDAWWNDSSTKWSISNGAWFEVVSKYGVSGPHIHIYEFKVEYN